MGNSTGKQQQPRVGGGHAPSQPPPPSGVVGVRELSYDEIKFSEAQTLLGAGGAGSVRKGEWRSITVAVKTLHIPDTTEFMQELRILAEVGRHPYIVELLGACTKPPYMAIVTQFMERGNLADLMDNQNEAFDWDLVLLMAKDICKGMVHIHSMGLIHRDLKSSNLLVASLSKMESEVRLKICDFGISKQQSLQMTKFVGTPLYMAPEMYIDPTNYNNSIDVYAFGIILWELITRKKPFHEVRTSFELEKIVREGMRPTIPAEVPQILADLVRACWSGNPKDRPTFQQALEQLERASAARATFPPTSRWVTLAGKPGPSSSSSSIAPSTGRLEQPSLSSSSLLPPRGSPVGVSRSPSHPSSLVMGSAQHTLSPTSLRTEQKVYPQLYTTISPPNHHLMRADSMKDKSPPALVASIRESIPILESSSMSMIELVYTMDRCAHVAQNCDRLPMEDYSEFVSFLGALSDLVLMVRRAADVKKYIQQPFVHRQIEQICSLLLRMCTTYHGVQLHGLFEYPDPSNDLKGLFLDMESWRMWDYYTKEKLYQDWDTFIECVKQFGATLSLSGTTRNFDEVAQRELQSLMDPSNSGIVTIFKFAALTNIMRPFQSCLQFVNLLKNCPWFHGYVSKEDADLLLKGKGPGTFMLHFQDPHPAALYLQYVLPTGAIASEMFDQFSPELVSHPELKKLYPQLSFPYIQDISWDGAFFGSISYEDAQDLLTGQPIGAYLIRLSRSSPGSFVIAYVAGEGKVHQIKIDWQGSQFMMNQRAHVSLKHAVKAYADSFKCASYVTKQQPLLQPIVERLRRMANDVVVENHYQEISTVLQAGDNTYSSVVIS
eukprot:TRINITY_DN2475_c0_g1_i1.p1 TRINITY_DN2475_c0_g1~~TRINITY_DN2475_c0_g1_i1.p1  ORF type:complete len:834 (-),score=248.83 TRINITY_DN2475_c0_g1_i1:123-2624(-)